MTRQGHCRTQRLPARQTRRNGGHTPGGSGKCPIGQAYLRHHLHPQTPRLLHPPASLPGHKGPGYTIWRIAGKNSDMSPTEGKQTGRYTRLSDSSRYSPTGQYPGNLPHMSIRNDTSVPAVQTPSESATVHPDWPWPHRPPDQGNTCNLLSPNH